MAHGTFVPPMADRGAVPGTDLVPLDGTRALPRELAVAADLALGAGARALRIAWRVGGIGFTAMRATSALPGVERTRRAVADLARPLIAEGTQTRSRSVERAQAMLEEVVPAVVELIDADAIVRRVDVDAVVATIDVDALLARVDVDALLARVDVDAFLSGVDVDALLARIDVDAIAARIDVNAIVQRVDVDAVVEETELGTIVARSTSGFASEALDAARAQTVGADTLVTRVVERLLRRRGPAPLGPPLLVHEEGVEAAPPAEPRGEPPTGPVP